MELTGSVVSGTISAIARSKADSQNKTSPLKVQNISFLGFINRVLVILLAAALFHSLIQRICIFPYYLRDNKSLALVAQVIPT